MIMSVMRCEIANLRESLSDSCGFSSLFVLVISYKVDVAVLETVKIVTVPCNSLVDCYFSDKCADSCEFYGELIFLAAAMFVVVR